MQIIVVFRVENDHFPPKTLYIWLFTGKHPLAAPYAPINRHRVQQTTSTIVVGHRERPGGVLDRISAPQNWLLELIPSKTLYNSGLGSKVPLLEFWLCVHPTTWRAVQQTIPGLRAQAWNRFCK